MIHIFGWWEWEFSFGECDWVEWSNQLFRLVEMECWDHAWWSMLDSIRIDSNLFCCACQFFATSSHDTYINWSLTTYVYSFRSVRLEGKIQQHFIYGHFLIIASYLFYFSVFLISISFLFIFFHHHHSFVCCISCCDATITQIFFCIALPDSNYQFDATATFVKRNLSSLNRISKLYDRTE